MFVPEREQQFYQQVRREQNPSFSNQNYQNQNQNNFSFNFNLPEYQNDQRKNYNQYYPSYPSAYSQASSTLNRDPLPNFMPTSIAPLNINLVPLEYNFETFKKLIDYLLDEIISRFF